MSNNPPVLRFRIVHLLYAMALLGSSLAMFGVLGLLPSGVYFAFWTCVFLSRDRLKAFLKFCVLPIGFSILLVGSFSLIPAVRQAAKRYDCPNNLKYIGLALHEYHDLHGSFPPAYIADEEGKPKHSWRVLILPFMGEQALYSQYDFDEPWNGPNNSKLLEHAPDYYSCYSDHRNEKEENGFTSYVAVVGPQTMWPGSVGRKLGEVKSQETTVLLVESTSDDILWMEPRDIDIDHALKKLSSTDFQTFDGHRHEDMWHIELQGRNFAMADGSIHSFTYGLKRDLTENILSINEEVDLENITRYNRNYVVEISKSSTLYRLIMFCLIVIFPLPWVFINPRPNLSRSTKAKQKSE